MDPDPKPPFGTAGSAPCPSPGPLRLTTCGDSRRRPERTYDLSGPLLPLHSTIICRLLFSRMSRCFFQSQETASHFNSFIRALLFRKISEHNHSQWRIGRDSNPRGIAPKLISSADPSTAWVHLQIYVISLVPTRRPIQPVEIGKNNRIEQATLFNLNSAGTRMVPRVSAVWHSA